MRILLSVCFLACVALASNAVLKKQLFDPSFKDALCNDGTQSGFYISRNSSSPVWLIHLQGGYWCSDVNSCQYRAKTQNYFVSSAQWASAYKLGGMFDTNADINPLFATANKVFLGYCTSDTFIGRAPPSSNSLGWYFHGAATIDALLQTVSNEHQANVEQSRGSLGSLFVAWTGCSAGGQGVLLTANKAKSFFQQAWPDSKFISVADAGWLMDRTPFSTQVQSLHDQLRGALPLWQGELPTSCEAKLGVNNSQCLFSPNLAATNTQPVLIQAEQFDQFQLGYNLNDSPPFNKTTAEWDYVLAYKQGFQSTMSNITHYSGGGFATFSPACYRHCVSLDNSYWSVRVAVQENGSVQWKSLADAVTRWVESEGTVPFAWVDACTEWNCSQGC